jgi:hypothetical protein
MPENAELYFFVVDLGAIGTFQIGQHKVIVILLDLEMKTTDALIVQLDGVSFLAADSHRYFDVFVDFAPIRAVQYSQSNCCHAILALKRSKDTAKKMGLGGETSLPIDFDCITTSRQDVQFSPFPA